MKLLRVNILRFLSLNLNTMGTQIIDLANIYIMYRKHMKTDIEDIKGNKILYQICSRL